MNEPIEIMLYETELMLTINVSIVVDLDVNVPCRVPRNKCRMVREFVYARILSCIPLSSSVYCYVNVRKQQITRRFCLTVVEDKIKYWAIDNFFFTIVCCNKLMCPCKNETHIANLYKATDSLQINLYYCSCWMTFSVIMPYW